jgi:tRNA(Ile)-lysidine synthase
MIGAEAFADLPAEIGLRLLQRLITGIGNEGPPELGQLETLYEELKQAGPDILGGWRTAPLRRTLAGALVTLAGDKLTVEPAPPRRNAPRRAKSGPKASFTTPR